MSGSVIKRMCHENVCYKDKDVYQSSEFQLYMANHLTFSQTK